MTTNVIGLSPLASDYQAPEPSNQPLPSNALTQLLSRHSLGVGGNVPVADRIVTRRVSKSA